MALQTIATGSNVWSLSQVNNYDTRFAEGDYQILELQFMLPVAAEVAGQIATYLSNQNVTEWYEVWVDGSKVYFKTQVNNPFPFAILAAFIAGFLVAVFVGWVLYKILPDIGGIIQGAGALAILGVGAGMIFLFSLSQG